MEENRARGKFSECCCNSDFHNGMEIFKAIMVVYIQLRICLARLILVTQVTEFRPDSCND